MLADSERVRHDRQRRIDRAAGDEEAAVDDVEIVQIMRLTVGVQRARLGIVAEAHGADLVRHTGEGDALADEQIARK